MRQFFLHLVLFCCCAIVTTAQTQLADGQKYALIIGISGGVASNCDGFSSLKYADQDAIQFKNFIQSPEGGSFPAANIRLLTNADATRDHIEREIAWLSKRAHRNDTIYVYFSGHGMEDENGIVYFMTHGTNCAEPSVGTYRSNYFLKDLKEKITSQHLIIFFDACHAAAAATKDGTAKGGPANVNAMLKKEWEESFKDVEESNMAFFSASSNQRSWEDVDKHEGVFTWFLIQGLQGAADKNQDKVVTAGELHSYLLDNVGAYTSKKFGRTQTPLITPEFNANFPLAVFGVGDWYARGVAAFQRAAYGEAIELLTQAIQRNGQYSLSYLCRGFAKYALGGQQGAIADFTQAIALDPKEAIAYLGRGAAKSALGDQQGAIADYNQALTLDPKLAATYNDRGVAKATLGDKKGAIEDFTQALALDPKLAAAYRNRGAAKLALGEKQGAMADFTQAIAFDPTEASAYHLRGVVKSDLGDKQGAIADYTQAIALDSKEAIAYFNYFNRGNAKSALGDKQGAIADYTQALALNPKSAEAYHNRGAAKSALGDKQGAIADLQQAARLGFKDAQEWLKKQGLTW